MRICTSNPADIRDLLQHCPCRSRQAAVLPEFQSPAILRLEGEEAY